MNALDELEEIKELVNIDKKFKYKNIVNFNCESIEKSLKALEIIKELLYKYCKIELVSGGTYYQITIRIVGSGYSFGMYISKEEFNLLKEVLE